MIKWKLPWITISPLFSDENCQSMSCDLSAMWVCLGAWRLFQSFIAKLEKVWLNDISGVHNSNELLDLQNNSCWKEPHKVTLSSFVLKKRSGMLFQTVIPAFGKIAFQLWGWKCIRIKYLHSQNRTWLFWCINSYVGSSYLTAWSHFVLGLVINPSEMSSQFCSCRSKQLSSSNVHW